MSSVKVAMMKAAMSGLYRTGAHRLLAPYTQGAGVIFSLHHVRKSDEQEFAPNRRLEVAPAFLDAVLDQVEEEELDVVSLDEAARRLQEGCDRRFVCFTFEDGYRDTLRNAYPIFKRRGLPFTVYVPTDYPSGRGELWWLALEEIVARAEAIELCRDGRLWHLPAETAQEKSRSYEQVYWWLRGLEEAMQRRIVRTLAERFDIDMHALCRDRIMNWAELRTLGSDPLVTIGAHGKGHHAIAKLSEARAVDEIAGSADAIERELGVRPAHFAFPYGDEVSARAREFALARALGFKTAVTARKGVLFPEHGRHLTALPRVSLDGACRSLAYTGLSLSGAPFALRNGFQQVNAA